MDVDALVQALGELAVMSPAAKCASAAVVAGAFAPIFPARFAAKDLRYAMAAADSVRSEVRMIRAAHLVLERNYAHGYARESLTAVAKIYRGLQAQRHL